MTSSGASQSMLSAPVGEPCADPELPKLGSGLGVDGGLRMRPAAVSSREPSVSQPKRKLLHRINVASRHLKPGLRKNVME